MSGPDIFISYSREDRPAAKHFAESFTREGFDVWWDAALRSGETFDEVIEKKLRAAKAVVVLWSPRSVASRWVRAEATLADRRNKLVPAIIEACDLPIIFELTHAANLADWSGDPSEARWQTLVSDIRRLVHPDEKDEAPAKPAAVEPIAKPKLVSAGHGKADGKALPQAGKERPLFSPAGRHAAANSEEPDADFDEDTDQTQFCAEPDGLELLYGGDEFHCLQMIDSTEPPTRFVVSPLGLRIGRTAPADIILAGAGVSRAHCLVELADDRLRIADLNSTNGTYIDDKRVDRVAFLAVGSTLRVGNFSFKHEIQSRAEVLRQMTLAKLNPGPKPREARLAKFS